MKKLATVLLSMAMLLGVTSCSSSQTTSAPASSAATTPASSVAASSAPASSTPVSSAPASSSAATTDVSNQLYIEVSALGSNPYFYDHKMGMETAGKELGVRTEYVGPAELDMNAMVAAFEQAIAKKPNGILVVGFDPQLEPSIKKATDAGIPVVTLDADLPNSTRLAFVGTGNVTAGKIGGEKMADLLGKKGKIALVYQPGQSNLEERAEGYKEALAKYPDMQIVETVDSKQDPVVAAQNIATVLQKYPDLAGIACVDAAAGQGAVTAIRESGKAGKIQVITMDRSNDILDGIKQGIISASVAQQTSLMPYYGVQLLMNYNNSHIQITTDNKSAGVTGVPANVDTGAIIIDKNNCKYFERS